MHCTTMHSCTPWCMQGCTVQGQDTLHYTTIQLCLLVGVFSCLYYDVVVVFLRPARVLQTTLWLVGSGASSSCCCCGHMLASSWVGAPWHNDGPPLRSPPCRGDLSSCWSSSSCWPAMWAPCSCQRSSSPSSSSSSASHHFL